MIDLLVQALPILHDSDSDGGTGQALLLLSGPIAGTALYAAITRFYRNADKRHGFEKETLIALKHDITGEDRKVDEVEGTRESHIRGDNVRDFRSRVSPLE